jgi:diguanylate cyclase (GGDEF)-like protein
MSAALSHRGAVIAAAVAAYVAVTAGLVYVEVPGLGIGHFLYIPIALLALATGTLGGAAAGSLATGIYVAALFLNPALPVSEIITASTGIRCLTYVSGGALIGAFAAAHRELAARLSELAERDFLTGLLNTRAFEAELSRRSAGARGFALLLGDVDGLKTVNDQRGHAEGNALLRRAARVLAEAIREGDLVARVGGDEFAVISAVRTTDEAEALCRRLEEEVEQQGLPMSFGWALHPIDGGTAIALYRRADERLYSAKAARRSRVHITALLPRRSA